MNYTGTLSQSGVPGDETGMGRARAADFNELSGHAPREHRGYH